MGADVSPVLPLPLLLPLAAVGSGAATSVFAVVALRVPAQIGQEVQPPRMQSDAAHQLAHFPALHEALVGDGGAPAFLLPPALPAPAVFIPTPGGLDTVAPSGLGLALGAMVGGAAAWITLGLPPLPLMPLLFFVFVPFCPPPSCFGGARATGGSGGGLCDILAVVVRLPAPTLLLTRPTTEPLDVDAAAPLPPHIAQPLQSHLRQ